MLMLLLLSTFAALCECEILDSRDAIYKKTYTGFLSNPCVTLASPTRPDGVSGKLYYASKDSDLDGVLAKASTFGGSPAAVMLASEFVSVPTLKRLMDDDNVIGIIIADGQRPKAPFSPASGFPNRDFGLKNPPVHVWNSNGSGWALKDLKKPWFSLGPNDTAVFLSRLNHSDAVSVEFKLQMKTSTDSVTCLRRGWCSDIGGVSLIASLDTVATLRRSPEIVVVMASVDSNAIMQTRAPGAVSDMSGTVALVAAFRALAEAYGTNSTCQRPSVFHWFNAEAWGYVGSKRFVQHMLDGQAIYNASSVWALLEAKQVGSKTPNAKLTIHAPANSPMSDNIASQLLQASAQQNVVVTRFPDSAQTGLPPSSLQSFLLKLKQQAGAAVLTDHGATYENQYYQSMFDTFENVDPALVCNAAKVLAQTVSDLQKYDDPKPMIVNCSFVTELLSCLSHDWRCPLFVSYLSFMANAPEFPSNYAGVFQGTDNMRPPIKLLHDIVTELNSPNVVPNKTCGRNADCFNDVGRYSCIRGVCVEKTRTFYWDAVVPKDANDTSLPLFAESIWMEVGMRLFDAEAPATQLIGFLLGILMVVGTGVLCLIFRNQISM